MRSDLPGDWAPPEKLLIISTFYRTGSNHLCDLMASTKRLGTPQEYLWPRGSYVQSATRETGFDTQRFFADVARDWETENGVAAIKLFPSHMSRLLNHVDLNRWFPDIRYIWLQRADTLGQAVSLALAAKNDDWFAHQPDKPVGRQVEASSGDVDFALRGVCQAHSFWTEYFARNDIVPFLVTYEDLAKNPERIVGEIAQSCDVELPANSPIESKFKRVLHKQNKSLRAAFVKEQERFGPLQSHAVDVYPRTLSNLVRFIKNKPLRKRPR
ncbi:Stf0 family sulfotransferase [Oricola indica]|uniref:Stf0 family sulfotransferase n=1 Tax=Oricola indica TaxID=2872591 RepID=UPI001CBDB9FD|nr:Stf0 family sulfotransferase [Oricola indica]